MSSSEPKRPGTFKPRPPDARLAIVSKKHTGRWLEAGYAYLNPKGGYSIRLRPGVVLRWDDEVHVTLWPRTSSKDLERAAVQSENDERSEPSGKDDDYPF